MPALELGMELGADAIELDVRRTADDVVALIHEFDRVERTILYVEDGTEARAFTAYEGRRATSTRQALRLALDCRWMSRAAEGQVPEVVHAPMRRWGIRIVTQQLVRRVHDAGRTIQVWTINEPLVASRLAAWQVDGIITDDVRAMRTTLRQRPAEMESEVE